MLTAQMNINDLPEIDELYHHGVAGQKWGVQNGPPYPVNRDAVFVSGSSKTQDKESGYYRKSLPKGVSDALDSYIDSNRKIVVGDAPGIDRQVQDYLNSKDYSNVEIYGPGKEIRYLANSDWKTHLVDVPDAEPGSKEWLKAKDIAMEEVASEGLAVILDQGSNATRNNIDRLMSNNKSVKVYQLNPNEDDDDFVDFKHSDYIEHHGISGQKWGVQNGPPYPLSYEKHEKVLKKAKKANEKLEKVKEKAKKKKFELYATPRFQRDMAYKQLVIDYKVKKYEAKVEDFIEEYAHKNAKDFDDWLGWEHVDDPGMDDMNYKIYINSRKYAEDYIKHSDHLEHHGILGQKWGDQNGPPYPLNPSQKSYSEKKQAKMDKKWIRKNDKKIRRYAQAASKDELREYERELRRQMPKYNKNGKINANYATAYSKKMAQLYNEAIGDLAVGSGSGSGKVVKFVAARGQMDVFTALADYGYNMSNVKNGVYGSGRIGYKKESVGVDHDDRR